MNKLFTKIAALALGATMAVGVGVAVTSNSKEAGPVFADTASFSTSDFSTTASAQTKTKSTITMSFSNGAVNGSYIRVYSGQTLTFSSANTITAIAFTGASGSSNSVAKMNLTSGGGTWNTSTATADGKGNWSGSSTSIVFTTTAQTRIATATVTYNTGGGSTALTGISLSGEGVTNPSTNNYALSIASADTADHSISVSLTPDSATDQTVDIAHYSGTSGLFTVDSSSTCTSGSGTFKVKGKGNSSGTETFKISGHTETSVAVYLALSATASRTVSFNSNGGSESPADIVVANGGTFTFPSAGTKSGYSFAGWSSDGGTTKYAVGDTSPAISSNLTYVGYWIEATVYTLVSDPSTLTDGTTFVLVGYASSTYRIGKDLNSGHVKMNTVTGATTISGGTSAGSTLITTEADVFTLKASSDSWEILNNSGNYLQFTGNSNGNDSFTSSSGANTKFTISGDSTIDIVNNSYSSRYWRYNTSTGDLRNGNSTYGNDIYMFANIASSSDTTTALSISSCSDAHYSSVTNTWTGYDSYTLDVSSFTISCTTSKATPAEGYSFKGIGYMSGENFVARDPSFSSGHPTVADTRLCWKANYPTTSGGSTYLTIYVLLSVSEDSVTSVDITGSMTKTSYAQNDAWDPTGFTVNAYYASSPSTPVDVTNDSGLSWSYSPTSAASLSTTSVTCTASFGGQSDSVAQQVTVAAAPVAIDFVGASTSGKWHPTASGSTFTDSAGHTATLTTDTGSFGTSTPVQIGKNAQPATYVEIIIPITKSGIENVSATFKSNGASTAVYVFIYGDTDNDLLASGSVTGNSDLVKIETSNSYEKINAQRLKYRFEMGGTGMFISQITYTLGATVTDFGTMVDLDILTPASNTQFKEGDTFSGAGLVLLATDDHVPPLTKNLTSGFKFGTSQGDDSFTNHVFDASDAATGTFTVYVTATVGSVTMSVTYTITVTEVPTYSPVSDYSSLYEGAKVIIVAGESAFGEFGVNQGGVVSPVFTDGNVTDANGATEFTVRIYGNRFGLQFGEYYLALNGDNNQVHRNLELNDAGSWTKDSSGISSNVEDRYLALDTNKFVCLKTGGVACALYISDKAPKTSTLGAETFAYKYLHMRDYLEGDGSCMDDSANHYYSTAKAFYTSASFSTDEKVEFAKLTDAVARLQAWARANGETFDPSAKTFTRISNLPIIGIAASESGSILLIVVVTSVISLTAIGGYFFLRKRREQN